MQTDAVTPRLIHSEDFAADAAAIILKHGADAIAERGEFRLALSGGNTPRKFHHELVRRAGDLDWSKVVITFGDERCVPPDHADSNYLMAKESLLDHVPVLPGNVLRMRGEDEPEAAAADYEAALQSRAGSAGEERYVHDLLLLGLGPDGHTASLFPDSPALTEQTRNVLPVIGPKPPPQRITMTFPLINAARTICFVVAEASKRQVVEEVLGGDPRHPASSVKPATWIVPW